jgi:Tfp pilus assembly protein PilF
LDPSNADAYFNLGWAYVNMKHFKKATRELEEALRLNPNHTGAQERLEMAKRMINQDSPKGNAGSPAIRRNRPAPRDPSQPVIIITP